MSEVYQKKMKRRAEREFDRAMLSVSKVVFYKLHPNEDINQMRPKVASIKSHVNKNVKLYPSYDLEAIGEIVFKVFQEKMSRKQNQIKNNLGKKSKADA